jgi:hypothetical protein
MKRLAQQFVMFVVLFVALGLISLAAASQASATSIGGGGGDKPTESLSLNF